MNSNKQNNRTTFRFPFDIDRRYFLVLAAIFFVLSIKPINNIFFPRLTPQVISKRISKSFDQQYKTFEEVVNNIDESETRLSSIKPKKLNKLSQANWSLQIYKKDSPTLWTKPIDNLAITQLAKDTLQAYKNNYTVGVAIKKTKKIGDDIFTIIGEFPLYRECKLPNPFFQSYFTFLNIADDNLEDFGYQLSPILNPNKIEHDEYLVKINGVPYFNLVEKSNFLEMTDTNFWRFFLTAIPFVLFGVSIHTYYKVSVKRNPSLYFSLLLLTILIIRAATYIWGFPDNFSEFHLFNPSLYAGDGINTSLGDVFINACLIFWALFFFIMNVQGQVLFIRKRKWQVTFVAISILALYLIGFRTVLDIYSIINDSGLEFDTTNYNNITAENIIGLGTVLLLFMNYVLMAIIFNKYFERYFPNNQLKYILPLIGIPFAYFSLPSHIFEPMLYASVWTVGLLLFFSVRFLNTKFDFNSYKLIYWLIFLSISCVLIIHFFDTQKELKMRESYAQRIIHFENKNAEFRLLEISKKIEANKRAIQNIKPQKAIAEHINESYLLAFEPEYNTTCKIFSSPYTPVDDSILASQNFLQIADNGQNSLLLKNEPGAEKYELRIALDSIYIRISLAPPYFERATSTKNPLLKEFRQYSDQQINNYEFAFYANDSFVHQTGIQEFPEILKASSALNSGLVSMQNSVGYNNVIAHAISGDIKKSIIVRRKTNSMYRISTTYAYIFTTIFILITLYILGNIIARSNLRRKRFVNLLGLTLRMRIHLSILLVELISLTIIGFVTIYIFSSTAQTKALKNANIAAEDIKMAIKTENINYSNLDSLKHDLNKDKFNYFINPYLQKHNVGLNIYNLSGERIFTTVSKKVSTVLPNFMNPMARLDLLRKTNAASLQTQRIGKLKYYTIYSYLRNKLGQKIGILEIPNFSSQHAIKQNNSRIITMLINIYAFVFLLSSLFAFYITKRLTKSFSKIVTQFSKINLTSTNEPLHWPYSDEIGLLIKEYNRTLRKLENSTALLAKSEREFAWREMAKQIAHDIKNPLTPMSLSLQSLQAAMKRNDPNVPAMTERMTTTVLEQIKVLTRTATNFSEFAKLIDLEARKESLIEILKSTTGIYSDSEKIVFLFMLPKKDIYVHVDKVKIIRVLTNVIQNAVQSIPKNRLGKIVLQVTKQPNHMVCISIEDNGNGMSDELKDKIFQPNFTTKSSGSGLGLAMSKDIILKTGGNIYFTTSKGKGSIFYIEIPIYKEDMVGDE